MWRSVRRAAAALPINRSCSARLLSRRKEPPARASRHYCETAREKEKAKAKANDGRDERGGWMRGGGNRCTREVEESDAGTDSRCRHHRRIHLATPSSATRARMQNDNGTLSFLTISFCTGSLGRARVRRRIGDEMSVPLSRFSRLIPTTGAVFRRLRGAASCTCVSPRDAYFDDRHLSPGPRDFQRQPSTTFR